MRRLLACAFLGPLTGPLVLGLSGCVRARRWPMAAVYAAGIIETIVGLPILARALFLGAHHG